MVVLPPIHVATGRAYGALERSRSGGGTEAREDGPARLPRRWVDVESLARNDFQAMVAGSHPEVARSLSALRAAGGRPALLSGSGAACFGVFAAETAARTAAEHLWTELRWPARAVPTLVGFPDPELLDLAGA